MGASPLQGTGRISYFYMNTIPSELPQGLFIFHAGATIRRGDPEYVKELEKAFVSVVLRLGSFEEQNTKYSDLIKRLLAEQKHTAETLRDIMSQMAATKPEDFLTREQKTAIARGQKFIGKKVSPARQAIYDEIERVRTGLLSSGAQGDYSDAAGIVAKKHQKQAERLYRSFMKYKNRRYAKSPRKRHSQSLQ